MEQRTISNIVNKKHLREVQKWTLEQLSDSVKNSAGPYGSTTQIINNNVFAQYTKDGFTIIKNIKFNAAIEKSIAEEITELARHIVKTVGDGTTSVVMLSNFIFKRLCELEQDNIPPYKIIESFKKVTKIISDRVYSRKRELQIRDVYDIAMICTNSDKIISSAIADIYKQYGKDVYINVGTSFTEDSYVNSYDGLTLDTGYASPAYINKVTGAQKDDLQKAGCCELNNPRIYSFLDPVNTPEMVSIFEKIVYENILAPYYMASKDPDALSRVVPTVVIAPSFSRDIGGTLEDLESFMYKFDTNNKPPLLIVTSSGADLEVTTDTLRLCGCKTIKKYIDPKLQEKDIADGKAVTIDNVLDSYGTCEMIRSTALKTTFINPREMFKRDEEGSFILDENGDRILGDDYTTLLNFLEMELNKVLEENGDANQVGNIKRRISSLKSNTVDYLVGGLTVTDRDSAKDLAEDAVKNIRSAAEHGVGFGANFEALYASYKLTHDEEVEEELNDLDKKIANLIFAAYDDIAYYLYHSARTVEDDDRQTLEHIAHSLECGCPMNLVTKEFDESVLSTIDSDPTILDAISKIITIMFTTNQCLVQEPVYNVYSALD